MQPSSGAQQSSAQSDKRAVKARAHLQVRGLCEEHSAGSNPHSTADPVQRVPVFATQRQRKCPTVLARHCTLTERRHREIFPTSELG